MFDMRRREFITLLGGADGVAAGGARRSNAALCGALVCSTESPLTTHNPESAMPRSFKDSVTWDGRSDATSRSTSGWVLHAIPALSPKWLHLLRKSY